MSRNSDRAVELLSQGYNCAQAVLAACGGPLGLARETALRVAGPFGAGIGRMGGTCGAVSGAFMAIGLKHARTGPGEDAAKETCYALAREFVARFTSLHKTTCCRELIGCDLSMPEGQQQARDQKLFETRCATFVRDAADIVDDLLAHADDDDSIRRVVRDKYAAVARSTLSSEVAGVAAVAQAFGYTADELAAIPAGANMGLSCGNPTATASLRPGEVVVDLGSGGGLDVFLAARKVGPTGRAIGIDMTPQMIARARTNAAEAHLPNVEFHQANIDKLPLPDASVDCVISNCVINLAPDKPAVFREIARVLKPGGRLAVSDIALKKPLPDEIAGDVMAYVGCIAGAIMIDEYKQQLKSAGFAHVEVIDSGSDLNAYAKVENQSGCCSPSMDAAAPKSSCCGTSLNVAGSSCCTPAAQTKPELHDRLADLLRRYNVNDYAASVKVYAVRPG